MLLPLPTPSEMALWDRETIASGVPGMVLMEAASREALDVLLGEFGPVEGAVVHCFAGPGNNGGDAFALGRQLFEHGAEVTIYHTRPCDRYSGDAGANLSWAKALGVPTVHLDGTDPATLAQPDVIIDGLLGTGFDGELSPAFLAPGARHQPLRRTGLRPLSGRPVRPERRHGRALSRGGGGERHRDLPGGQARPGPARGRRVRRHGPRPAHRHHSKGHGGASHPASAHRRDRHGRPAAPVPGHAQGHRRARAHRGRLPPA